MNIFHDLDAFFLKLDGSFILILQRRHVGPDVTFFYINIQLMLEVLIMYTIIH